MGETQWEKIATATTPLGAAVQKFEDGASMLFANLLTLMILMLVGLEVQEFWQRAKALEQAAYIAIGLAWIALDIPYLARLWRVSFRGNHPWAFETAQRQWIAPVPLRPIIALWWLAHFAIGVWFALGTTALIKPGDPLAMHVLNFLITTSYGFAANGYLILSVCAMTRSQGARDAIWDRRGLLVLALGVAGALVPPQWVGVS
jgi:hypothetical protein